LEGRPDQWAVWSAVERRLREAGARSETADLMDAYAAPGGQDSWEEVEWPAGQVGVVATVDGRTWWVDVFDHPDTWRVTASVLLRGYAWSAGKEEPGRPAGSGDGREQAWSVLRRVGSGMDSGLAIRAPVGRGRHVQLVAPGLEGKALVDGDRVVHVFACVHGRLGDW
jgi:hypothetical protein